MTFLTFILRRARRHWQVLLTLLFGVLLATALLASSPMLVDTVVEFGLRRTLISPDPLQGNLRLRGYGRIDADTFATLHENVTNTVQARLSDHLTAIVPAVGGRWMTPWLDGIPQETDRIIIQFYGQGNTDIANHITFVEGGWPETAVVPPNSARVVIGQELATAYNLQVGDKLPLSLQRSDPNPAYILEISGIAQPTNPADPYWFGSSSPLRASSDERWAAQYSAIVPAADLFPTATTLYDDPNYELTWHVLLDPATFTTADIPQLRSQISQLSADLRALSPAINMETNLSTVLDTFLEQATAVRAPLYFLTAEVVLLTLYYVIMIAALAVRQVEREFAVLQSRGAAPSQIFRIQAGEGLLISLIALISGPLLAYGLVNWLAFAGPLADLSEPGWRLTLPQSAWLAALIGTAASLIGLLLPVNAAVKRTIVNYQQQAGRSGERPLWQRAYLDVFILAIGLVLLWRLQYFGSIVGGSSSTPRVDWLLLLSPLTLLIGSGTILLRVFPLLLRGMAAIAARGRGLVAALALWQSARNPAHVARLVLLLTLAMSLGILSTGINATLDISELERANYATGSDIRLISRQAIPLSQLANVDTIQTQTNLWRGDGSAFTGRDYWRFDVMAIEPYSFSDVTRYRPDYAQESMGELLGRLVVDDILGPEALPLPGEPVELGLWLWAPSDENMMIHAIGPRPETVVGDSDLDRIGLEAKVATALGEYITVELTPTETGGYPEDGWRYFRATLDTFTPDSYPLTLQSLWLRNRVRALGNFGGSRPADFLLAIDDITVVDAAGQTTLAADMEDVTQIWQIGAAFSTASFDTIRAYSGRASRTLRLQMARQEEVSITLADITRFGSAPTLLPGLVSPRFISQLAAQVGDTVSISIDSQAVDLKIVGVVDYFPTMYEDLNAGFVITNRDVMLGFLNGLGKQGANANEALVAVTDTAVPETVGAELLTAVPAITDIAISETVRKTIKADPMALGLRSVTFFGYVLTTTLSLVGFATYFYLSARQKESIYAMLRSIGMSPRQLYASLVLEQIILILAGLALGTLLGVVLNQITLPGLPITLGDRPPTPPFIARNDWGAIGRIYLTLTIAFLLSLGLATALLVRTRLHRILRVGEE